MNPVRVVLTTLTALSLTVGMSWAADMPEMPKPGAEHQWLQQLVGEWEAETEANMEPGKPPVKAKGTENIRSLGGFWTVAEIKSTMMDMPFVGNMTLGYDTDKQKYVGTWVDSVTGHLWAYEGTVDPTGKILTLETEGTCPMRPGKLTKFRDAIELKDKNHKIFTTSMQDDNGQWVTMMTSHAHRK